jgi:predicted RNA-binding protein with PIN domain
MDLMPILIDGHNLIARLPGLSLQDPDDEKQLIRLLISYAARVGKKVTVVFDPGEAFMLSETRRYANVEVVFAPQGSTADAAIVRRMQRSRNPGEWLVITSDQKLAGQVAGLGARTRSADAFARDLDMALDGTAERTDVPLSADEVEAWLQLFKKGSSHGQVRSGP